MIRKDVMRLAERLHEECLRISTDTIYYWLMGVGLEKGINPRKLEYITGDGIIFVKGERDINRLETLDRANGSYYRRPFAEPDGPDYEGLILARQERYMD